MGKGGKVSPFLLTIRAFVASYLPACRAMRVDPMATQKYE
jgi:hypothetical protein